MINKLKNIIFIVSILFAFTFVSCKREFEEPAVVVTKVDFSGDTTIKYKTIAELKAMALNPVIDTIKDNIVIKAVVSANDESGNLYKTIFIQDASAGIELKLDKASIYNNLKVGQRIYIKCKGLYVGLYGGVKQLGYIYNGSVGRIPEVLMPNHIFIDSLPGKKPEPLVVYTSSTLNDESLYGKLIKLENFHFEKPNQAFVVPGDDVSNRVLLDSLNKSVYIRTSKYAKFSKYLMPKGVGSVTGVLSSYNGELQFYIRDYNDVKIDPSILVDMTFFEELFAASIGRFTQFSVSGAQTWVIDAQYKCMKMSGYFNSSYNANEDWLISPAINISGIKDVNLSFQTAMKYGIAGDGSLKVFYSTNYAGSGDPTSATWTEFTGVPLSTGNFAWQSSGNLRVPEINGNVYFAFKYVCSTNNVPTWEVKEFKLRGKM